jgi:hypothetical protein
MLLFVVALELSSKLILKTNTTWNANQFSDGDGERRFNAKENEQSIFLQLFGGTGVLFRKFGKGTHTQTSIRSNFVWISKEICKKKNSQNFFFFLWIWEVEHHIFPSPRVDVEYTVCFTNLGKLNFLVVIGF